MGQKIKKVNSSHNGSEGQSFVICGNLHEVPADVESFEDDHDIHDDDDAFPDEEKVSVDSDPCTLQDYQNANKLCDDVYGVNLLELLTKLLLNGELEVKEFVVQGLAYKVQSMTRGSSGVRYQKSWGMFWAATRNIVRNRGLVAFRDHFSVPAPSQLAKSQKDIVQACGLKSDVGGPGMQSKAAELWVNSKKVEAGTEVPCLSVSMDAKKIAVTESGVEDLAGLGSSRTNEEESDAFERKIRDLEELIIKQERKGLYNVFDAMTMTSQQLINRILAIEQLLVKNKKSLPKNPLLSKYIYVLNNQLIAGKKVMKNLNDVQSQILDLIADKRNCTDLRPRGKPVDIVNQKNYLALSELSENEVSLNFEYIKQALSSGLLNIKWATLKTQLVKHSSKYSRATETFKHLYNACFLSSDTIYAACGLGTSTPVLDMKNAWSRAHSVFTISKLPVPVQTSLALVATFCSSIAVLLFGKNAMVNQGGIFIKNGICAAPDLVVRSNNENIDYTVRMFECNNVFEITEEVLVTCLVDSYICDAVNGAIAVLNNDQVCVAIHIPPDSNSVRRMVNLSASSIRSNKCIVKRTPAMLNESKQLKGELIEMLSKVTILGCFPLVNLSGEANSGNSVAGPVCISDLRSAMQGARMFLAKKAKELVALNVSDLSGNSSRTPHTILGATYLTSSSLKLVGRQCLDEVCAMLTRNGAKVLNIGVDGESLYLASILSNGSPGTLQTLVKHINEKLKAIKKENLIELVAHNPGIELSEQLVMDNDDEDEEHLEDLENDDEDRITEEILDSAAILESVNIEMNKYTIEDIEDMLGAERDGGGEESVSQRKNAARSLTLPQLRMFCLKYLLPKAKPVWLENNLGTDSFDIHFEDGETLKYKPNTVFEKIDDDHFRTITFDFAHIINLFREHAAKGRLHTLGLEQKMLEHLSQQPEFDYLKKIIATKGNKLVFDSMNQKAAASLFSEKTVEGLQSLGYDKGANCVNLISGGLLALDDSGIDVKTRIIRINALKNFLEDKNNMINRVKRADNMNMTNELLEMVLTTLDSHIYTSMNMQFFNVRRKGTGTVEQLFGQMMMMTDGCGKLDVRQLKDVLKRLTLTNALRLVPNAARGFKFLSHLKQHMKSYKPDDFEEPEDVKDRKYPTLNKIEAHIFPQNSLFDKPQRSRRKRLLVSAKKQLLYETTGDVDKVRKYHKKF